MPRSNLKSGSAASEDKMVLVLRQTNALPQSSTIPRCAVHSPESRRWGALI